MAYKIVVTKFIFLSLIFSLTTSVLSLPFVVFNGFANTCKDADELIQNLEKHSAKQGQCITLGENSVEYSIHTLMTEQVELACKKVKELDELKNGYNLIGVSQGSLVSRGLIEFCDEAPPVKNFISLGGPQAGIGGAPNCTVPIVCDTLRFLATAVPIYNDLIQALSTPSNYMKKPMGANFCLMQTTKYQVQETPSIRSGFPAYITCSLPCLRKTALLYQESLPGSDITLMGPPSTDMILPFNETKFYKEDLIGLKTLYEAGKVTFKKAPGDHIHLTETLYEMITPFLIDDDDEDSTKKIAVA